MAEDLTPPHKPEIEKGVLGAALRSMDGLSRVMQDLTPEHFYVIEHQAAFEAMRVLADEMPGDAERIDGVLLARRLERRDGAAAAVKDPERLVGELFTSAATLTALDGYIADVRATYNARRAYALFQRLSANALGSKGEPELVANLLGEAESTLSDLSAEVSSAQWRTLADLAPGVGDEASVAPSIDSGFPDLDRALTGGFRKGNVVCFAARPGMGKSTITADLARHASIRRNKAGLIITLEMTGPQLAARLMSAEAGVDIGHILAAEPVSVQERDRLDRAIDAIVDAPLYVVDSIEPTWPAIGPLIRTAHRRLGIEYVVIDYIQLLSDGTNNPNREQEIAKISKAIKNLALQLDLVVFVVAQLNRGPESRADKRPQASDLRESGQLEQDSDIVALLFRPDYYDPITERAGEADVILAKNRWGSQTTVALAFQGHYSRFVSMAM